MQKWQTNTKHIKKIRNSIQWLEDRRDEHDEDINGLTMRFDEKLVNHGINLEVADNTLANHKEHIEDLEKKVVNFQFFTVFVTFLIIGIIVSYLTDGFTTFKKT